VIGQASTAPAYSLAAVIGIVVVVAGVRAPAVLLASSVPMFSIAAAFYYMNRADQDAAPRSRGSRERSPPTSPRACRTWGDPGFDAPQASSPESASDLAVPS